MMLESVDTAPHWLNLVSLMGQAIGKCAFGFWVLDLGL